MKYNQLEFHNYHTNSNLLQIETREETQNLHLMGKAALWPWEGKTLHGMWK